MDLSELQRRLLQHYGLRVEDEMGRYVLRRLTLAGQALAELPVIGGDARTGMPLRISVSSTSLRADISTASPS